MINFKIDIVNYYNHYITKIRKLQLSDKILNWTYSTKTPIQLYTFAVGKEVIRNV